MALGPPPVAAGSQLSFQTTFRLPPPVHPQYAALKLPSALKATSLWGFHVQPYWSWDPPTAVTYGLDAGQLLTGKLYVVESRCCFATPRLPESPDEAKNVSPFAIPFWKTASSLAVWLSAAPPKVCSVTPE